MRSKNRITYENRMCHYLADLEIMDILRKLNSDKVISPENDSALFLSLDRQKHRVLAKRKITRHNRDMAIFHMRQTLYSAFIKDIYEELYRYLRSTIFEAVENIKVDPDRLIGEHKISLQAKDILKLGSISAVNEKIIDTLFQTLEAEQSTIKLITKVRDKLGLSFDESLISDALPYLELRHKLVHADGKLDAEFRTKYPIIKCTSGSYAILDFSTVKDAYEKITSLIIAIDQDALAKRLVNKHT